MLNYRKASSAKNYFKVSVIDDSNHSITVMKNTVIDNQEYVTLIVSSEVRGNIVHELIPFFGSPWWRKPNMDFY